MPGRRNFDITTRLTGRWLLGPEPRGVQVVETSVRSRPVVSFIGVNLGRA